MRVSLSRVNHRYDQKNIAFDDFEVQSSQKCLISGPSGSGKSTLIQLIAGVIGLQEGSLEVGGIQLRKIPQRELDLYRLKWVGYMPQKHFFWLPGTVCDQVALPQFFSGRKKDLWLLNELGIWELRNRKPATLSVGQQQRLSLARALATKPKIILADEPTSSLDKINAHLVLELFDKLHKELGFTLIVSSHDERIGSFFDICFKLNAQ